LLSQRGWGLPTKKLAVPVVQQIRRSCDTLSQQQQQQQHCFFCHVHFFLHFPVVLAERMRCHCSAPCPFQTLPAVSVCDPRRRQFGPLWQQQCSLPLLLRSRLVRLRSRLRSAAIVVVVAGSCCLVLVLALGCWWLRRRGCAKGTSGRIPRSKT